mmetsp:Transcript_3783/g.6760  ORF Transcript_3783/g.6760 Transcript_3783/m.6760 type:complete len:759 (-) Transcript_3783:413-2689(-)
MVVRPLKTYRSEMRKLSEKMGVIENTMTKQEAENLDAMLVEIAAARWQLPMLEAFKECMSSEVIHSISTKNDRANIFVCFASIRDSARDPENDLDSMMHEFNDIVAKLTLPDSALGISELVALEFRIQTVLSKFAGPVPPPVHERVINDESTQHTQSGEREHADSINDDDDDDDEAGEGPATQAPRDDSDDEDDGKEAKAGKSDKSSDGSSEASALRTDPPSKDPATKLRKAIDSTWVEEDDIMSADDNINLWPARAAAKLARDSLEEIVEAYRTAQRSRPRGNRRGGQNQSDKNLQDAHNLFWAFETAHSWPDFIKLLEEFMRFCQTFVVQHPPKLLQLMRQGRQAISRASSQSASMHGNDDDDDVVIRNRNTSLLGPATPRSHLRRPTKVAQHSSAAPRSAHQQHMASSSSPPSNRVQGGIPRSKLYTQLQNEFLRRHGNSYEEWEKLRNLTPFDAREKVTTFVQSAVAANSSMPPTRSADIIVHHNSNHDSHHHHHNHHQQHESDELLDESRFHYNMHGSHSKRKLHAEVPKHYASGKRSRHHDDDHDDGFPHMAPMDDNDDRDTVVDAAKALRENSRMLRNKFKDPLDLMLLQSKKLTIQPAATSSGLAEGESSPTSTMAGARPRPRAKRRLEYDSNPENDSPFASQFGQDENRSPAHQDDRASHINSDTLFERAIKPLRKTRRKPVPWTMKETDALVNGVRLHGKGNWAEILRENRPAFHSTRTSVSLKDRYRNIELKRVKDDKDEAESAVAE